MKAFVVFVPQVRQSRLHTDTVLSSIQHHQGWEAELLPGVTPDTLPIFEKWFPMTDQEPSRISGFRQHNYTTYLTKKSCFYNHVRVWRRCVEIGEPVAFIEHDAVCVRDWDAPVFDEILILNPQSSVEQPILKKALRKQGFRRDALSSPVVTDWQVPLYYRQQGQVPEPLMMPGTAAYAVTPGGAQRLLQQVIYNGWEQSDHFINDHNCVMQFCTPDYFDLRLENLRLSHGIPQDEN